MRRRVLLALMLLVVGGWVAAVLRFIVWPREQTPRRTDAVVVLSGDHLRLGKALELMARGEAPTLVISDGRAPGWHRANRLCRGGGGASFRVMCFKPRPYSTRGEARGIARLAGVHGWRSVLIVTSTYHVTRARLLFQRCGEERVAVTGATYRRSLLPLEIFLEPAKLAYALVVRRGC